ncbi:MAG: hypothetical protein HY901_25175 [Deltaproteobacteria bacterium]|nr:hypothetical protein [Deltaproteobacteria bacterium]
MRRSAGLVALVLLLAAPGVAQEPVAAQTGQVSGPVTRVAAPDQDLYLLDEASGHEVVVKIGPGTELAMNGVAVTLSQVPERAQASVVYDLRGEVMVARTVDVYPGEAVGGVQPPPAGVGGTGSQAPSGEACPPLATWPAPPTVGGNSTATNSSNSYLGSGSADSALGAGTCR